jgi:CO/xanthine dehydrogenase FAD-binding subunit
MTNGFEVRRPRTRAEALELLARPNAAAWVVAPRPDLLWGTEVATWVDLSLLGLDSIQEQADGRFCLGAATSLQQIATDPLLAKRTHGMLARVACQVAPESIRNLATVWGALQARQGSPEFLLALLVLEAEMHLLAGGEVPRAIRLSDYLVSETNTQGDLLLDVTCRSFPEAGCVWALERVARTPRDEAIVAALVYLEVIEGIVRGIRLALAGAAPRPVRVEAAEQLLADQVLGAEAIEQAARVAAEHSAPVGDFRGSVEYRRAMVSVVIRRALQNAWKRVENSSR